MHSSFLKAEDQVSDFTVPLGNGSVWAVLGKHIQILHGRSTGSTDNNLEQQQCREGTLSWLSLQVL